MKYLLTVYWCAIIALIVFFLSRVICRGYYAALRSTGETIMARDVIGVEVAPYVFALVGILMVIIHRHK